MKKLLVFLYFCPSSRLRAGGVQQVVGPLLDQIELAGWTVTIAHTGPCSNAEKHVSLASEPIANPDDHVDPEVLVLRSQQFRALATEANIVLSIDRVLPSDSRVPCVLMSNSLAYVTEATAVLSRGWTAIVAPSEDAAGRIRKVNEQVDVHSIPYGFSDQWFQTLRDLPRPNPQDQALRFSLPHRPDCRKGHREAILGLSNTSFRSKRVELEISWLDEPRYAGYRAELEALVSRERLTDRVTFSNWGNGESQWDSLRRSHGVLQIGSFLETFGLAALEAVLSGRLAVTFPQPAVREIIGDQQGFLEITSGPDWVSDAIRMSEHPCAAPDLFYILRVRYSLQLMVTRYLSLFERLLDTAEGC